MQTDEPVALDRLAESNVIDVLNAAMRAMVNGDDGCGMDWEYALEAVRAIEREGRQIEPNRGLFQCDECGRIDEAIGSAGMTILCREHVAEREGRSGDALAQAVTEHLEAEERWASVQSMTGSETWHAAADRRDATEKRVRNLLAAARTAVAAPQEDDETCGLCGHEYSAHLPQTWRPLRSCSACLRAARDDYEHDFMESAAVAAEDEQED